MPERIVRLPAMYWAWCRLGQGMSVPDADDDRAQRERRFRALYQEHYDSIRAYAVRRLASAEDVADVVAETFTAAGRLGSQP